MYKQFIDKLIDVNNAVRRQMPLRRPISTIINNLNTSVWVLPRDGAQVMSMLEVFKEKLNFFESHWNPIHGVNTRELMDAFEAANDEAEFNALFCGEVESCQ